MQPYELSERERISRGNADRLNAIMAHSSLETGPVMAAMRAREQAAARLQRQRNAADTADTAMALGIRYGSGGPFKGTSMDAQSLNAMWKVAQQQGMTKDQFMAEVGKQRMSRPTNITTPEGTYTRPGMDFSFMGQGGGQGGPAGDFTPRNQSGDEKRGNLAVAQIQSASPGSHRPGFLEEFAQENFPASVASLFTTDEYALSLAEQRQYLTNLIYLQSGAAAGAQEVEDRRLEFFPQNNDSKEVIAKKAQNLEAFKQDAAAAFQSRRGGQPGGQPGGVDYIFNPETGKVEPAQ
jgi:hypothetical protein